MPKFWLFKWQLRGRKWRRESFSNKKKGTSCIIFVFFLSQNYAAMKMVGPFGPAKETT